MIGVLRSAASDLSALILVSLTFQAMAKAGSLARKGSCNPRACINRLLLLVFIFVGGLWMSFQAVLAEPVGVRATRTNDYGRVVFVWRTPVDHDLFTDGRRVTIRFGRPFEASYQRVLGALKTYISRVAPGVDGRSVTFVLKNDFDAYSFDSGRSIILEIAESVPPKAEPESRQSETSLALVRRQVAAQEAASGILPKIRIRVGIHSEYTRVVFDFWNPVEYSAQVNKGIVRVKFEQAVDLKTAPINRNPPKFLGQIRAATIENSTEVEMTIPVSSKIRHFISGPKVVVDIRRPIGSAEIARLPSESQASSEVLKSIGPSTGSEVKKVEKFIPSGEKTTRPVNSKSKAEDSALPGKPVALRPVSQAAYLQNKEGEKVSSMSSAKPQDFVDSKPRDLGDLASPRPLKNSGSVASKPVDPGKPASEEPPNSTDSESATPPKPVDSATGVKLRFDWNEPVAAAVFRRLGFVWVIFNKPTKIDTNALVNAGGGIIRSIDQVQAPNGTVLRFKTKKKVNPSLALEGASWIMEFKRQALKPTNPVEVKAQPKATSGARIFLPVPEPGSPVGITDPLVGDNLVVVPVISLGHGVAEAFEYPELEVLKSAQGIVVRTKIDDLRVKSLPEGVELTSKAKLAISPVSDEAAASAKVAALKPVEKLLDLESWEVEEIKDFNSRKQELQTDLAGSRGSQREEQRMDMVRFYFANGFHVEALGILARLQGVRPQIAEEPEFRLIRGAVNYFLDRVPDAARDLSHTSLDNNEEANFWRAAAIAKSGDLLVAAAELRRTGGITRSYPKALMMPMGALVAEAATELGDIETAREFIDALIKAEPTDHEKALLNFINGKTLDIGGDVDGAITQWDDVLLSSNRPVRVQAAVARMDLLLKLKRVKPAEAIVEFEKLRFAWRGDDFEFRLLRRLGGLYLDEGLFRKGLEALRQAATYFKDKDTAKEVKEQMAEEFSRLYLREGADAMRAVTAIAVYREFKELTPSGARGDEMIRKLADRLADVDLLEQAAEILEGQVRFRLSGPLKAEVGARLAVIYLLARQFNRAVSALIATNEPGLNAGLETQRRHLLARALMGMGRDDDAVDILKRDKRPDADILRAEIFWKSGDWARASNALKRVAKASGAKKGELVNEFQAERVLNYAISLALSGNERGLARLRSDLGSAMERTSLRDAFRLVTAPTAQGLISPSSVTARVKLAENFKTFLGDYKKRLKERGLSSLTEQTAKANNASVGQSQGG